MLRQLSLCLVLCGGLTGCQSAPSIANWSGHSDRNKSDNRLSINDLSEDNLRDLEGELFLQAQSGAEREFRREQIAETTRGSQVGVYDETGGRYCGTVLHAGPDRLELMNCLSQEAIPGPDGQLQCKKSHIPFLTIESSTVIHFVTIAPPPPNFPKTDEEIAPSDYSVAEIVNRSGQRHRWGQAPEAGDVGVASVK